MNKEELKNKLIQANINPRHYSLYGTNAIQGIVLDQEGNKWFIYYVNERGDKINILTFYSEDEACQYFFNRVVNDPDFKMK
jgi:hypothetical protein